MKVLLRIIILIAAFASFSASAAVVKFGHSVNGKFPDYPFNGKETCDSMRDHKPTPAGCFPFMNQTKTTYIILDCGYYIGHFGGTSGPAVAFDDNGDPQLTARFLIRDGHDPSIIYYDGPAKNNIGIVCVKKAGAVDCHDWL